MTQVVREAVLSATVAMLVLTFSAQLHRSEPLPTPPSMLTFVVSPPPSGVTSKGMAFMSDLDTTVQELRLETQRGGFTSRLGRIVSVLGSLPDSQRSAFSDADMRRLRELVEETVEAIEQRIDSGGDELDTQQHLAGTVYEVRRRMEIVEQWFSRT